MKRSLWICALCLFPFSTSAFGATVKNLATGFDDAGSQKLTNNTSDTDYTIAAGGTGGHVGETPIARSTPIPLSWAQDSASTASRWIGLNSGVGLEGLNVGPGSYIFQTTVDLTGFDPATAVLSNLRYMADNKLISVAINGTSVFSQDTTFAEEFSNFINLSPSLGAGLFHSGANTITFGTYNQDNATTVLGLRLEGAVTATPVPEPATAVLLLGASIALIRRKR